MTTPDPSRPGRPVDPNKDRAILHAARDLLFDQGPAAVTMERVAQMAGVSKVTVYRRFVNRLDLLQAVVSDISAAFNQPLLQPPAQAEALRADLTAFVAGVIGFVGSHEHGRLLQAVAALPAGADELAVLYQNGPRQNHQQLAVYLTAAATRGLLRCADPEQSAEWLLGLAIGLDWTRAIFRLPRRHAAAAARRRHSAQVVAAFLVLHAMPDRGEVRGAGFEEDGIDQTDPRP